MGDGMKHLLCFGFGFSAEALSHLLDRSEWQVTGTSRSDAGVADIIAQGFSGIRFDTLRTIPDDVTHILSSVPPDDAGDIVLQRFGQALAERAKDISWAGYLSTTGVYGDHGGGWVDEATPLTPNTTRGERRVAAERGWLELHKTNSLPLHVFRLAGIYGPGRNQLESLRNGTAKRVIKEGQVFSRIHVDDIAGILLQSIARPHPGRVYNVADDEPCPPQDVVTFGADILGMEPPAEEPFEGAVLSAMGRSFFADSKRVRNDRVKQELQYRFKYPDYRTGLRSLLTR